MTPLAHLVYEFSPTAAGFLIASVWQGLLLTAGVALGLRFVRGVPPAVRTMIWAGVLVLVVLLPMLDLVIPHGALPAHAGLHVAEDWSVGLLAVWATFAILRAARLIADGLRLRRVAARAVPVDAGAAVASLLQKPRRAVLCVSPEINRPSVTGFFRPRVLLPEGLLETLSPADLEHVVLHEMEHLRRGDDWLNLLQQIALVLLPLNPALFWLDRRLCRERELACDDAVLQETKARNAYAACLVKLAEDSMMRKGLALAMSALGTRARESELVARVRRILAGPERVSGRRGVQVALGTLTVAVLSGVVLLARSPNLVSFDGEPTAMAQVSGFAMAEHVPLALPVSAAVGQRAARPVLTRAVLDRPGMATARTNAPMRRKAVRLRTAQLRTVNPVVRSWSAVAVKAVAPRAYGVPRTTAVTSPAQILTLPPARLVVTEFEVSQPVYAAVPWRDGWLIVQL